MDSKRAVVRYMKEHGREKGTAAWLSREYDGSEGKSLFFTKTGNDIIGNYETVELSWPKIQRRIAKLIQKDDFFTDYEKDHFEDIDPIEIRERLESGEPSSFVERVMADVEAIAEAERIENEKSERSSEPTFSTEVETVYPAEENHLPYDVVIERLHVEKPEPTPLTLLPAENFRITDDALGVGGSKAKFRMNMDAIHLLKQLERDGRQATPEEQEILSRYVGWGGLADAFDPAKDSWKNEYQELQEALTKDEYTAARSSTLNAHYTSPTVIKGIYEAVEQMGFQTGNILEPSMGVGNFFGLLPDKMAGSRLYGVELDSITGRVAKQLYPKANITVSGFEKTDRRDFYDLAIGNVPFGQYQVHDPAYNNRASCWCCPFQRIGELRKLRTHHPELWARLMDMDQRALAQYGDNPLGRFKQNWTVAELDARFAAEEKQS